MTRLLHVIRHEASLQFRNIAITAGAVAGSILVFSLLQWFGGIDPLNLWPPYEALMIILGLLITTGAFTELRSPGKRIEFLLRPATAWEKVAGKLLVTTVGVWIAVTLAFLTASIVGALLYLLAGGPLGVGDALMYALADGRWLAIAWRTFLAYLPAHAIFFFGAVYFQRHSAGKTLLAIVAWITSTAFFTVITARIVFNRYFSGSVPHSGARRFGHFEGPMSEMNIDSQMWREIAPFYLRNPEMIQTVVAVAIVVIFWSLAVLRLRETEA